MASEQSGGLSGATAHLERAAALMVHSPEDYESFASCLGAAISEFRVAAPCPREELARFHANLVHVNTLFHGAQAFYRGWCGLAGVAGDESAAPASSIEAWG